MQCSLFCCGHWILTEFFTLMECDSQWLCIGVSCKSNTSVFLSICKRVGSRADGTKGRSEGINSSNCQKSMKVSGSRSLHRVLAALAKCKRPRGVGASCLSEQCHMNKLSEMGNRRRNQWDSHLCRLKWLFGSLPFFKTFRSRFQCLGAG